MPAPTLPELRESKGQVLLSVHVQPRASRDRIVGRHGDACKVAVSAPPAGGRANSAVTTVVAEALGVPARAVTVVAGQTARRKHLAIDGISLEEAGRRLAACYEPTT